MQLSDTIDLMQSEDYKDRFKAEYLQTKIRYEKLKNLNNRIEAANRTANRSLRSRDGDQEQKPVVEMPKHDSPDMLLREQQNFMEQYLRTLEVRAAIEGVDIYET